MQPGARIAILNSYDAAATLWFDALRTAGAGISAGRRAIVSRFVRAEKQAGTWSLTDDCWPLWAESSTQALVSLKQLRTATVTAAPVFTADRGYTFNGTSNFINTGFIPNTHSVAGLGTNQRLAVYERSNVSASTTAAGTSSGGTVQYQLRPRNGGGVALSGFLNCSQQNLGTAITDSRGFTAISRTSTQMNGYKNGVPLTPATGLTVGTTLPTVALYIGCLNNNGTAATFRASDLGFACIGAQLTDAQELAQNNNVQQWATSVGAQT